MRPRWEQVDGFLWKTPLRHGWLYRDMRDCESHYKPDPERGWIDSKWALGSQRTPAVLPPASDTHTLQSVDIAESFAFTIWAD